MLMSELIDFLNENDEVGLNQPTTEVKIAIANIKLRQLGLPQPGKDFHKLLQKFNGLSNNGCVILGINHKKTIFPDIVDYNELNLQRNTLKEVILGYDDAFWLTYNENTKKYRIIDPDDETEEASSENLADMIPYILHI